MVFKEMLNSFYNELEKIADVPDDLPEQSTVFNTPDAPSSNVASTSWNRNPPGSRKQPPKPPLAKDNTPARKINRLLMKPYLNNKRKDGPRVDMGPDVDNYSTEEALDGKSRANIETSNTLNRQVGPDGI